MAPADFPELTVPAETWVGSASSLTRAFAAGGEDWTIGGRRVRVDGAADGWVLAEASGRPVVRCVLGTRAGTPGVTALRIAPDQVERRCDVGGRELVERWAVALEHPVIVYELTPGGPVSLTLTLADLAVGSTPVAVQGGAATSAIDGSERRVAIESVGDGPLRIAIVAARDDADRVRAVEWLGRRGLEGLLGQRAQHARLLADYGVTVEPPEAGLGEAFEWAKVTLDAAVAAIPPGRAGRALEALLAAGNREAARVLLGRSPRSAGLAAQYLAWTGDAETLRRHGLDVAAMPVRRGAGSPVPPPQLERLVRGTPAADGVAAWEQAAALVLDIVGRLWRVEPDAPNDAVSVVPDLPEGWSRMSLARLRVGSSVLDLALTRRFGTTLVRVRRAHGPRIRLALQLAGAPPAELVVDDVPLGGTRAVFAVDGEHEVAFRF